MFESKCYILSDQDHLGKFDAKSDEGVFIGYSTNSRAYRVYNMRMETIMESINVVIDDAVDFIEFLPKEEIARLGSETKHQKRRQQLKQLSMLN